MALSKKQQAHVDRRHATAIRLIQKGVRARELHRHTADSLFRRGFINTGDNLTAAALDFIDAYEGGFEPEEYILTKTAARAGAEGRR